MKRIVSAVPGRLRIKDPYLSTELAVASISASLSRELPIQSMRPNLVANSIVLHYDAALIDLSAMKAVIENLLAKLMRQEAANDSSRLKRRSAKRKLNRYAKIAHFPVWRLRWPSPIPDRNVCTSSPAGYSSPVCARIWRYSGEHWCIDIPANRTVRTLR